jgi:hypothetical protein
MQSCFAIDPAVRTDPIPYRTILPTLRELTFPGDKRRLMDIRRSGVVEAIAGDAGPPGLSAKLANSIERSNALHRTYAPVDIEAVRNTDAARLKGRRRMRDANENGVKVSTQQSRRVSTGKGKSD